MSFIVGGWFVGSISVKVWVVWVLQVPLSSWALAWIWYCPGVSVVKVYSKLVPVVFSVPSMYQWMVGVGPSGSFAVAVNVVVSPVVALFGPVIVLIVGGWLSLFRVVKCRVFQSL